MQIVRIRSRVVDLPLPAPFHPAWARGRNQTNILMVLVEVETDAGITGCGAAHADVQDGAGHDAQNDRPWYLRCQTG